MTARHTAGSDRPHTGRTPAWVPLAGAAGSDGAAASPPTARRVLTRFVAGNAIAASLLLAASVWASHEAAQKETLADALSTTDLIAGLLIEPNLEDELLAGDPVAVARLDAVVEGQLRDVGLVRIKIWDEHERVVYSDEDQLVGRTFPSGEYDVDTLAGDSSAEFTDLTHAENVFEREEGQLLEVYRPVSTPDGQRLVLETYFHYNEVTSRQQTIWLNFAPITVAAMILLLLFQVPLAYRMIREVRAADGERLRLQARAADATTEERRRIAGSLHDGVVQDLSAAPLIMSRAVERLEQSAGGAADQAVAADLRTATDAIRQSVASLRSLLIEIYPPHLARAGLPAALGDLAARARARGVDTRLDLPEHLDPPQESAALLFRVAQEALLNVVRHSGARTAQLSVREDGAAITMLVSDDGRGFDAGSTSTTGTGHFGLRVLGDLAEAAGARLDLATAPGRGTTLRLVVPR